LSQWIGSVNHRGDLPGFDQAPQRIQVPYNNQQAKAGGDGQAEAELDIEVVNAIAPAARLLVYVSPESKGAGLVQGNRMVSDDLATVISISWGFPENYIDTSFVSKLKAGGLLDKLWGKQS